MDFEGKSLPYGWTLKEMEEEERRERRRRQKQKVVTCCKKFAAFLFSHIGLASMVVAYSILGGFVFQAIEAPEEERMRQAMADWKEGVVEKLCRTTVSSLNLSEPVALLENFREEARKILTEFQQHAIKAGKEKGWDGTDTTEVVQWSFAGALLYALTVITTIG